MTAAENPQTTIAQPETDDDRPKRGGGRRTTPAAEAPVSNSAKKTRYRIYLAAESVEALHQSRGKNGEPDGLDTFLPAFATDGDLFYLATLAGVDRDAAVESLLDGEDGREDTDRVKVVRAAHFAHVDLDFEAMPDSYRGLVPVHWKVEPTRTISGR